jgi:hypothetical protein
VNPKSSAQRLFDTAITYVRVQLYNELTATRVDEIVGFDVSDSPSTEQELLRADAIICETMWVRAELLIVLKSYFADETGSAQQDWNELGILRDNNDEDETIENLMSKVNDAIERIKTNDVRAKSQVRATSFGAEDRIEPGSSIWG